MVALKIEVLCIDSSDVSSPSLRPPAILCKLFANKNCLHFSANKIVRKQMDANNANNFSKHIGIKVEIF